MNFDGKSGFGTSFSASVSNSVQIYAGGQNFRFPIDFAGHRYNSADAAAQPMITHTLYPCEKL